MLLAARGAVLAVVEAGVGLAIRVAEEEEKVELSSMEVDAVILGPITSSPPTSAIDSFNTTIEG